jgi:uncharacterized protein YdeI (YjbR/CyaY-like superfamily)
VRAAIPPQLKVLATTRVVDLEAAERMIRDGVADLEEAVLEGTRAIVEPTATGAAGAQAI